MSNRGFINPILLIVVAAVLVAGGFTAWATGAFRSADAGTTTENNAPSNARGTSNDAVANPCGSRCPVTGKTGGMMEVALDSGSEDCSGCPSMKAVIAGDAAGCSGCADKSVCDSGADRSDCGGCEKREACEDCPDEGCEGCPGKSGKDCCGDCEGKQ